MRVVLAIVVWDVVWVVATGAWYLTYWVWVRPRASVGTQTLMSHPRSQWTDAMRANGDIFMAMGGRTAIWMLRSLKVVLGLSAFAALLVVLFH